MATEETKPVVRILEGALQLAKWENDPRDGRGVEEFCLREMGHLKMWEVDAALELSELAEKLAKG